MGGNVFTTSLANGIVKPLTSRLSSRTYYQIRKHLAAILADHYEQVSVAREAPEKTDHGDVDFLVQGPRPDTSMAALQHAFSAMDAQANGPTMYFAVPFREPDATEDSYAQVDVHACDGTLAWMTFRNAYGCAWQVLGGMIKHVGLTPNDKGLYLRLDSSGSDAHSRKATMLFLSADPPVILSFLGMDWAPYEAGFATVDEFFGWLATCRFLARAPDSDNHRKRNERPLVTRFWDEYLPSAKLSSVTPLTREEVTDQAVAHFSRQTEFAALSAALESAEADARAAALIGAAVRDASASEAVGKDTPNLIVRAMKRWATLADGTLAFRAQPEMQREEQIRLGALLDSKGTVLREECKAWIEGNWLELKTRERSRAKEAKALRGGNGDNSERVRELK